MLRSPNKQIKLTPPNKRPRKNNPTNQPTKQKKNRERRPSHFVAELPVSCYSTGSMSPCLSDSFQVCQLCKHSSGAEVAVSVNIRHGICRAREESGDKGGPPNWRTRGVLQGAAGNNSAFGSGCCLTEVFKTGLIKGGNPPRCLLRLQVPRPHGASVQAESEWGLETFILTNSKKVKGYSFSVPQCLCNEGGNKN